MLSMMPPVKTRRCEVQKDQQLGRVLKAVQEAEMGRTAGVIECIKRIREAATVTRR
jgi:hypothetical protein